MGNAFAPLRDQLVAAPLKRVEPDHAAHGDESLRDQLVAERFIAMRGVVGLDTLQWGRDQLVAERSKSIAHAARRTQASMGPRPIGRGEPPLLGRATNEAAALQ